MIPQWILRRAKWDEFKNSCILILKSDANVTVDDNITYSSKTLISLSIPKTSNKKHNKSWFNDDCKTAIRSRKAALRKFNLQPSAEQKLVELSKLPRKHIGEITSINLTPPSRKKYGT